MAQTILADMDTWKRVAGNADADGAFTIMVFDAEAKSALDKVLQALNGIRARLDAGINTKVVTSLATVNL